MEVLIGVIVGAINASIAPLARTCARQVGYLLYYKRNVENLANEVDKLERMRNDVERSVETALRRGDSQKEEVEAWIKSVDSLRDDMRQLHSEAKEINSCFKGWCCAHFRLGKEAKKKIEIAKEILTCGERFSNSANVSEPTPSSSIEPILIVDFQDFDSRKHTMKKIMEALKCEENTIAGVYGMPGVGKTTLMKEVEKRMIEEKVFNKVLWVIVSRSPNLINIQNEIAEQLGMGKLEEESKIARARRLHMRLKSEEKVLLILDDLWQRLEFGDVGIPHGDSCKVVLTTRKQSVCNDMEIQPTIEVRGLSLQESRNLFRQKAGDVMDSIELQTLASQVADECEGLPLAIVTLGRALRGKDLKFWEEAYRRLKESVYFQEEGKVVYFAVKFSFENLESDVTKSCFLFCCFFPEDYRFTEDELLAYVMGEKLLPNVNTLDEARHSLHWEMDKLVSSCLLLKTNYYTAGGVRMMMMHDVVRDVAISIASAESYGFFVKAGLEQKQWPSNDNSVICKRMSLMRNKINDLPDQIEHPNLLTLSLVVSSSLKKFPNSFFERMTSLLTLDLKNTPISSLPSSLSCLVNLSALCLDDTSLHDVSLVGKLKKLEILSLRSTLIESLPEEIGGLANLKYLNLSNNRKLEVIPQNLLSSLSHLEELYMTESFRGWEIEEMGDGSKATLAEVASLNFLSILHLDVDDIKCFSDKISAYPENLTKFHIRITTAYPENFEFFARVVGKQPDEWYHPRTISLTTTSYPLPNWVRMFLEKTNELWLHRCEGLKNVVKLDAGGFDNLKLFGIIECSELEYVMSLVEEEEMMAEEVLQTISTSTRPLLLFPNLTQLYIEQCNKLKYLFPLKVVRGLKQLLSLSVRYCKEMNEIIIDEEEKDADDREEDKTVLPQLINLELSHLPNITSLYPRAINFDWPSLNYLVVKFCPNLSRLPFGHHSAPKITEITIDNFDWFESLKWEDESIMLRLQKVLHQDWTFKLDGNCYKDEAYRRKVDDVLLGMPGVYRLSSNYNNNHIHIRVRAPRKVTTETLIKTLKDGVRFLSSNFNNNHIHIKVRAPIKMTTETVIKKLEESGIHAESVS